MRTYFGGSKLVHVIRFKVTAAITLLTLTFAGSNV